MNNPIDRATDCCIFLIEMNITAQFFNNNLNNLDKT